MYVAKIENRAGDVYVLNTDESAWQVASITGLDPPRAQINMTTIVGLDGAVYNSSKLETRNIVITIRITGDTEANRIRLYRAFRTKEWCRFYYKNSTVDAWIDGYVEAVDCGYFEKAEVAQISIICPAPYFKSAAEIITDISSKTALFEFSFAIDQTDPVVISSYDDDAVATVYNETATPTGVTIEMDFQEAASLARVQNADTGEHIELEYDFRAGDRVTINTKSGEKSVTLLRGGVEQSIFSAVVLGSEFFQLEAGPNSFQYEIDGGTGNAGVYVLIRFRNQYRGV